MTEEQLRKRWLSLCERLGATDPDAIDLLFRWIVSLYSGHRRCYHTMAHIEDCLQKLNVVRSLLYKPDIVEMALWLHDIICNTRRKDNEEQSAKFVGPMLSKMGIPQNVIGHVKYFILATKGHKEQISPRDLNYLLDIDMSILGADPPEFDEYERGISKEYWWLKPVKKFRDGRTAFLNGLVDPKQRKSIFITEWFQAHYESQARENIKRSLARLSK